MLCCSGKIKLPSILKNLFISTTILIGVSACGGGSDGGEKNNPQPLNQPPSANAGTDQSVDEKTGVTLAGSGTDSDGTIASYSWAQTSGTIVTLQNADSSNATFEAPEVTTDEQLIFELTVTDDDGATGTDSVQITIRNVATANQPPSARAGSDQSVDEKTNVTLTGSGTDSDGTIVSYSWAQTSGTSVTLQNSDSSTATFEAPEVTADEQLSFELTVTDNDGAVATDSVQITILNVASPNQPPSANAGESKEALESTIVMLDGSESFDSDGSINSYSWEQISNGAPVLTITNERTASASIELPVLANNVEFGFRLTVTDNDGNTAQDEVIITGRPTPGVIVGDVSGNTASLNAAAEFSVKLTSAPSSNVRIPISSSDEGEGASEQSELIFTPENWQQAQTVVVRGTNENVSNGEQEYQIILGAIESSDKFYNTVDPDDVMLKGIFLEISEPATLNHFIAGLETEFQLQINYTGNSQLSFSLTESPEGMEIDLSTGKISWTPQKSDEGQTYSVTVAANDGNNFASKAFQVNVVKPEPISTVTTGRSVKITDTELNLNGVIFRFEDDTTTFPEISTVPIDSVASSSPYGEKLTEIFLANDSSSRDLEVLIPLSLLAVFNDVVRLSVFHYIADPHTGEKTWSPVKLNLKIEEADGIEYAVLQLGALKGVFYIGLTEKLVLNNTQTLNSQEAPFEVESPLSEFRSPTAFSIDDVECKPRRIQRPSTSTFIEDHSEQTCEVDGLDNITFTVKGFGDANGPVKMWSNPSKSIEEMIVWAAEARKEFDVLGIGNFDRDITIQLENRDKGSYGVVYSTSEVEKGNILHITNRSTELSATMQVTIAHEYMHHAQVKTQHDVEGGKNIMTESYNERRWISEGTAMWFEDYLYDGLDDYKTFVTGARIFEKGVSSEEHRYNNITFWKLILNDTFCPAFKGNIKNIFYNNFNANDTFRIKNLSNILSDSNCNFGSHLGGQKSTSLEAAISYYNYTTQFKDDLSLLDSNESKSGFNFSKPTYQFNKTWLNTILEWLNLSEDTVTKLNGVSTIPPAGAFSFKTPSISGELPDGKVAELIVESDKEIIVSVTSEDIDFVGSNTIGNNAHQWFSTTNQTSYIYDANGTIPELFVTLVNANIDNNAKVDVYFKIRDELDVDTIITSHTTGEQVFNRVVSIAGSIPEEARDSTSKVTVTANGIASDTTLNEDGSFVADVVVTLGNNVIKAQGFSGSTPVTNEEIITIQGVESSSTGRNALIASKVVFVLRWDTDSTDLDIYSTDKNGGTIWYSDKTEGPGNLDYDNTSGYGPEVVSYRATDDDIYVNGTFDIDVHYYAGSPSTNYSLDVVLNEIESGNRRSLKFDSVVPHTQSSSRQDDPGGSGVSRFNDILTVSCSSQRVCSLARVDTSKLAQAGSATPQPVSVADATNVRVMAKSSIDKPDEPDESAYKRCMRELESSVSKAGYVDWACSKDGAKLWH